jgi:isoaspartyl peptidase/L-asparaginase-like protein (Ntn-hydrolase superfamily)
MVVTIAGYRILAAQVGASETAIDAVVDANLGGIEKKPAANPGHGSLQETADKMAQNAVSWMNIFKCTHILPKPPESVK